MKLLVVQYFMSSSDMLAAVKLFKQKKHRDAGYSIEATDIDGGINLAMMLNGSIQLYKENYKADTNLWLVKIYRNYKVLPCPD